MNIRNFYIENYPSDELGIEINKDATFIGLLGELIKGKDPYEYIKVYDSLIRERLFDRLASLLNEPYEYVYNLWMNSN